jgi:Domain of unknown function DUF29
VAKTLTKSPEADLYETDYHRWLEVQADLLREGRLEDIDAVNLIEELEESAVGERASVESHTETIIEHLLKLQYSAATRPRRGWRLTVRKSRARLKTRLSATLRAHLLQRLPVIHADARDAAAIGLEVDRVPPNRLPTKCPYSLDQILDPDWLPANLHGIRDQTPEGAS